MIKTPTYQAPPEWIRRGVRVLVDAADLEPDEQGHRPFEGEGEIVAIVTHVGDPLTGKRTGGPVWLRREGGGLEATARGAVLHRAPGTPASEQFAAADELARAGLSGPGGPPPPGPASP